MANNFIFVRLEYSGGSSPTGWAEYQTGETAVLPGNLNFSGTGRRITGDMSSSTLADRLTFQTTTANGATTISALPTGTGGAAGVNLFNTPDPDNATITQLNISATQANLTVQQRGTGANLPLVVNVGGAERMRVDSTGGFYVGTTSTDPVATQSVGIYRGPAGSLGIYASAAIPLRIGAPGSATMVSFTVNGATAVGSITTNGTTTAYNTSSDYRLKDNVQDADATLAWNRLDAYRIRSFVFKTQPTERVEFAGIAHELAEVNSDMVTGIKDGVEELGTLYAWRPLGDMYSSDGELLSAGIEEPADHTGRWVFTGAVETAVAEEQPVPIDPLPGTRWEKTGERMVVQGVDWSKVVPELILNMQTMKSKITQLEQELASLKGV